MNMYMFTDQLGTPVGEKTQKVLDDLFSACTDADKKFYDRLIHINERQFENFNREICSVCDDKYWQKEALGGSEENNGRGCCCKCKSSKGYANSGLTDGLHKPFKNKFCKTGFFDMNIMGCSLPRHIRSPTCLRYSCDKFGFDNAYMATKISQAIASMRSLAYQKSAYREFDKYDFKFFVESLMEFVDHGGKL
jgi:hypothetical protein